MTSSAGASLSGPLSTDLPPTRATWVRPALAAFLAAVAVTSLAAAGQDTPLPVILGGVVVLALIGYAARLSRAEVVAQRETCLLACLAVLPIGGIAQAAVALDPVPVLARPLLVALVLVAGVVALTVGAGLCDRELGLRVGRWRQQASIALTGVPLGLAAFALAGEGALSPITEEPAAPLAVTAVVGLAAVIEELYFRGLLTRAFTRVLGPVGLVWAGVAFALPALATGSLGLVVVLLVAGLVWGLAYERTGSIVGTALAHALTAVGAVVIWPALF